MLGGIFLIPSAIIAGLSVAPVAIMSLSLKEKSRENALKIFQITKPYYIIG